MHAHMSTSDPDDGADGRVLASWGAQRPMSETQLPT